MCVKPVNDNVSESLKNHYLVDSTIYLSYNWPHHLSDLILTLSNLSAQRNLSWHLLQRVSSEFAACLSTCKNLVNKSISGCVCMVCDSLLTISLYYKLSTDLLQVNCHNLLSAGLLQVASTRQAWKMYRTTRPMVPENFWVDQKIFRNKRVIGLT